MIKILRYFLTIGALITFGCGKARDVMPYASVNITIYPSTPQYYKLNAISGWQYVNGGVNGLIVYRKDVNDFMAYERTSTYQPSKNCICSVDTTNNVVLVDACSGSKFLITDCTSIQGPGGQQLVRYSTTWDGNVLQITN